ncbi:MAG: MBL fold metallo-hydrolase [Deltaproteobacteria bacterium]|jgi:7,8-dihydropterin-6-yl-methyl-4-(beta-D-ribofuranosyl)aminobenzene 5'-phosphate synthase
MALKGELSKLKITVLAEDSVPYESPYLGQHGVSFLVTADRNDLQKNILVDVAQNPAALLENMRLMDISPSSIDAVVLTHCHYDHTQGLVKILRKIDKKDVPVIAHPDIFRLNYIKDPYLRHVGVMDGDRKADIEDAGGTLFLTKDPFEIMPGLFTTGEVERATDFEEVGINLMTIENGRVKPDPMRDDISLIASVKEKGLVIITGCSHAGIVNIAKQAIRLAATDKIHGVIGGFHLIEAVGAAEKRITKTVQALKEFDPDWVYAGHCTGFPAQVELYNTFKERFSPLHTGVIVKVS